MKTATLRVVTLAVIVAAGLGFASLWAQQPPARAATGAQAPLRILCSTAVHTPVEDMLAQIERAAGRPVAIDWDSSQRLSAKIDAGEAFDIAIFANDNMNAYIQKGAIAAGSRAFLGRTGAGIGVKAGAPKPDVSTPEKLKQALLNAKSITMNPTGSSAVHFNRIVAEMGIAEQLKPKMMLDAEQGRAQKNVAEGKAELVWTQVTEIKTFPELDVAGPLPAQLQSYTEFYIGIASKSSDAIAADAVVKFLTSTAAAPTFKARLVEVR